MAQKILVIDEPQTAADIAENVFTRHFPGCDVLIASRGSDVFERLNAASPDLVLLNSAAALVVAGIARDLAAGLDLAHEALDGGGALAKLRVLQSFR